MYVRKYVCMYECMYVCMYVRMSLGHILRDKRHYKPMCDIHFPKFIKSLQSLTLSSFPFVFQESKSASLSSPLRLKKLVSVI